MSCILFFMDYKFASATVDIISPLVVHMICKCTQSNLNLLDTRHIDSLSNVQLLFHLRLF